MAYTDTRGRPSKTSIGGAIAINGLMIAGIIFAAPDILPEPPWTVLGTYRVPPDPAPPPPAQPISKKPVKVATAQPQPQQPPQQPQASKPTNADNGFTQPFQPPTDPGAGMKPADPLPVKPEPIFKTAQLNPRYADALQPTYPPGMIRAEIEGVVTIRVLIGTDGRVKQVEAVRSDNDAFLETTRRQALGKWRFLPATRDGVPIESWREMTVRFRLPD